MTKAERTKQLIIEKSAPIFNVKGVAGTAMSDIMEATKLAKGSLYVHFDSKETLSQSVVDYCLSNLSGKAAAAISAQQTAKNKLFAFIDFMSDPQNPPVVGGCPIMNFGAESDDTDNSIRQKINKAIKKTQQLIAGILNEGVDNGEFKKNIDTKEFALKIFALLEGGILVSKVAGNNDQMKTISKIIKAEIELIKK